MRPRRPHCLAAALLAATACTRSGDASSSFSGGPGPGTGGPGSEGSSATGTSSTSSGSGGQGDVSTGAAPGSTGTFDAGVQPDFVPSPAGCKGKIDFLFLVSRDGLMADSQAQLTAAFPQFIDTIESTFADFDYHIMVVDGDGVPGGWWGDEVCNQVCPDLDCKVGDECCPASGNEGEPCCYDPNYPCEAVDSVTFCDEAWGAGTVFPAGLGTADKPCPIDGGRRFLAKGQTNLDETFACIATVGMSGYGMLGQALTAAVDPQINGGCNNGFLRPDALLMVTFIHSTGDSGGGPPLDSEGTPAEWKQAVLDAKHGDERSVVVFDVGFPECDGPDGICKFTKMWPYHHSIHITEPDYGPGFAEAANLVDVACEAFVPPPG
ncbi:MAG: hypothetical protein JNL82_40300 [Myxococcales bacterium]|nr:hypothetical protein [Myxococcales bacterium]